METLVNPEKTSLFIDSESFTGRELQEVFNDLIGGKYWRRNVIFEFSIKREDYFTIKPNPTRNQPGNGLVEFSNLNSYSKPSWRSLYFVVSNNRFPEKRQSFLQNKLSDLPFDANLFANILMSFEIARRVKVNTYPLSREQTAEAIDVVMASSQSDYPTKVTIFA